MGVGLEEHVWYDLFIPIRPREDKTMGSAIKKTISLPPELAREAEEMARSEGVTVSAVIQDAIRRRRAIRLKKDLRQLQGYWSRLAKQKGVLTEKDLERILRQ